MKVKDAVKYLLKEDQEAILVVTTDNFEQGQSEVEANYIHTFKGDMKKEIFTDAFDRENYEKEVIRRNDEGKKTFVKIS